MYTNTLVRLDLLGLSLGVPALELDSGVSPFTGRPIRRLQATVRAEGDAQHERLTAELSQGDDGDTVISGPDGVNWQVINRSMSFTDSGGPGTVYTHTFELQGREELTLARVEFGELALVPERWSLNANLVSLTILVRLDRDQHKQFERFHWRDGESGLYFPVMWVGISDKPVSMRFGQCLWEAADDGGARHIVTLIAEEGDGDSERWDLLFEPWQSRVKEQSAYLQGLVSALLGELEQAGALDREAIDRIKDKASVLEMSHLRAFDRVNGIEGFFP